MLDISRSGLHTVHVDLSLLFLGHQDPGKSDLAFRRTIQPAYQCFVALERRPTETTTPPLRLRVVLPQSQETVRKVLPMA